MMYCEVNYKTKKALKEAVKAGSPGGVFQPNNIFNVSPPENGKVAVGGPHYPAPHKWYAQVTLENGKIVKVS